MTQETRTQTDLERLASQAIRNHTDEIPRSLIHIGKTVSVVRNGLLIDDDPKKEYLTKTDITKSKIIGELNLWSSVQRLSQTNEKIISVHTKIVLEDFEVLSGNVNIISLIQTEHLSLEETRKKVRKSQIEFYNDQVEENNSMLKSMFETELKDRISLLKERGLNDEEIQEIINHRKENFFGRDQDTKSKKDKNQGLENRKRRLEAIKSMRFENNYFFIESFPVYIQILSESLIKNNKSQEEINAEQELWSAKFSKAITQSEQAKISRDLKEKISSKTKSSVHDPIDELVNKYFILVENGKICPDERHETMLARLKDAIREPNLHKILLVRIREILEWREKRIAEKNSEVKN